MVITNKDGKPRYVPNPFEDIYESVRDLAKSPELAENNEQDYEANGDDSREGRPTAPDDTGARFGNSLGGGGGGPDDFAGGHHFFDDFSAFEIHDNGGGGGGGRPISPGIRPRSPPGPPPLLPPSRRQRKRRGRPSARPPPQYDQVKKSKILIIVLRVKFL